MTHTVTEHKDFTEQLMQTAPYSPPCRPLGCTGFFAATLGIGDLAGRNLPLATCVATTLHR